MGRVSKRILDNIITKVREATAVKLWKNSASVIDWFKNITEKGNYTFVCFDIVEYYPSISPTLSSNAMSYAKQFIEFSQEHIDIIMHARKSLLFENGKPWVKKERQHV